VALKQNDAEAFQTALRKAIDNAYRFVQELNNTCKNSYGQ
jgi:hypothetical protein